MLCIKIIFLFYFLKTIFNTNISKRFKNIKNLILNKKIQILTNPGMQNQTSG